VLLLFALSAAGCASTTVAPDITPTEPVSGKRPSTIYVYNFAVSAQEVTLNQGLFQKAYRDVTDENQNAEQLQLAHQTAQEISGAMVQHFQDMGFIASQIARGTKPSGDNILIVDGQFVDIDEGNRLRRMVIGLGVGKATMSTQVQVNQVAGGVTQQIMDFTTDASSGEAPGALITGAPGAVAGGSIAMASLGANVAAAGGKTLTSSMDFMAKRTAAKAAAYMSQYFAAQNWIPNNMVQTGNLIP